MAEGKAAPALAGPPDGPSLSGGAGGKRGRYTRMMRRSPRWTWWPTSIRRVILLATLIGLGSCSASPSQAGEQLSAEQTLEKVDAVFRNTPRLDIRISQYSRAGYQHAVGNLLFAEGNRVRLTWDDESKEPWIWNGGQRAILHGQPFVGSAPCDFAESLKRDLMMGQLSIFPWSSRRSAYEDLSHWEERDGVCREVSHTDFPTGLVSSSSRHAFGKDPEGLTTLTYAIRVAEWRPGVRFLVTIHYDPSSFFLRRISSRYESVSKQFDVLKAEIRPLGSLKEDLFTIPEDPQIRILQARVELAEIRDALDRYLIDTLTYPTTAQGLGALLHEPTGAKPGVWKGPYLKRSAPILDPWGNPYTYRSRRPGIHPEGWDLWSWGYDGKPDTLDDIHMDDSHR